MNRIAYLASQYPAPSHTFIRREIAALRSQGLTILPFSVRPGYDPSTLDGDEIVENVLGRPVVQYFVCTLRALRKPRRFYKVWKLALQHRQSGIKGLVWAQFHFVEALLLCRLLQKAGITHLHNHFANSGATVGLLASRYLSIPWSLTLHGISETDHPAGELLPDKLSAAIFVACASWFMRAQGMRKVQSSEWGKFHIVRCGVDLQTLPLGPITLPTPEVRFVCVGRLSAEKGYFGLLDAFGSLLSQGISAELGIVGDGPLRDEIEARLAQFEWADRVRLYGALPEQKTLQKIAESDILVLPSLMEGLPVVLMEAMALRKPVIASHVAGIPELVDDGNNGLLFTPGDWDHLEQKMLHLATNRQARLHLGENARATIEKEFEITKAVQPLAALFQETVET
ncbi:glycosyltransferase family 4 protein [Erythrobacter sp. QSSC1-22B]|uniref:glycosyltransferase family 4 protein n=1 Tax=Erythrobacter sp. QSSC1-22B TaxID=1860125 RepID=UPI001438B76B|nr:glycosyltransferase family 4 protein [Erythrobacter sp. QSSC1-22B]